MRQRLGSLAGTVHSLLVLLELVLPLEGIATVGALEVSTVRVPPKEKKQLIPTYTTLLLQQQDMGDVIMLNTK